MHFCVLPENNHSPCTEDMYLHPQKFRYTLHIFVLKKICLGDPHKGCAAAEPTGPWWLTFAYGWPGNTDFCTKLVCWAPWISRCRDHGLPNTFIRAQPCTPLPFPIITFWWSKKRREGTWIFSVTSHNYVFILITTDNSLIIYRILISLLCSNAQEELEAGDQGHDLFDLVSQLLASYSEVWEGTAQMQWQSKPSWCRMWYDCPLLCHCLVVLEALASTGYPCSSSANL